MFFLGIPYRPISFFIIYKALLAGSFAGVYFYIGVIAGVIGRTLSLGVLVAVAAVCKVGI